jgi:hypothetical protein
LIKFIKVQQEETNELPTVTPTAGPTVTQRSIE